MDETPTEDDVVDVDLEGEDGEAEAPSNDEPTAESLPLDQVFGILKNQRRRYVLKYLHEADGQASLSDIAEQIAAWENDKEVRQISSSERKRVYVGLYQCHLPKMDGADVIDFNKPRGTIEIGKNADSVYTYLDTGDGDDRRNPGDRTMQLSLVGTAVLAAGLMLRPVVSVPVMDIAVVAVIGGFLFYSLANLDRLRSDETDPEN